MLTVLVLVISLLTQARAGDNAKTVRTTCPEGFMPLGTGCYSYFDMNETYDKAREICQLLPGDNVDLAVFDSHPGDATFISTFAINNEISSLWVGSTDEDHEGYWTWVDGRPLHPESPYWNTTMPRGSGYFNCGIMSQVMETSVRMRLMDTECSKTYPFICQLGLNPLK
ncbi:regenerating islet-derived protein 3-beta-like isoform X3 [Procambarus clarkii]|uniref:regenerating islet-derived protein 3-beta-like isoform X3 n=1 Tax=Procambarus clarkii TaxID=6728 RepID=UPI003743644C